jgi:cellulose synthase operon protein C
MRLPALVALALAASPARAAWPELPPSEGRDPHAERVVAVTAALERDRRTPRGVALLAELADLEAEAPELARIGSAYGRAADDREAFPEVRALARYRLAELERRRGNFQRSAAILRRLGFVSGWRVIGPFDDEGKRGFDAVLPPEKKLDLAARLPGKAREVVFRPLPDEALSHGLVHLGAMLRPAREVVAYAVASVDAPREARVQLWFGGSGAAKVWVNGAVAIADPAYHPVRLDQRGAWVTLRKGPNRILVKLCHQAGRMAFFLRLADERGDGLSLAPADPALAPVAPGFAPQPLEDAVTRLEARADAAHGKAPAATRAEADARMDLARALEEKAPLDEPLRRDAAEPRPAAALVPRDVEAQLLAARLEEEHGARRRLVEAALAAAPEDPRALRALAEEEVDAERPQAAVRLLERAIAAAPGWAEPRVALASALERAGLGVRGAALAARTAAQFPTVPGAVRAAARAARRLGRTQEAALRLRTLLALRLDDVEARGGLVQLLLDRGDVPGALALFAEGFRLEPSEVSPRLRAGDLLAANGRADEAEALYATAVRISPEEADVYEARGRARLAAGRTEEARADLARALDLRPQSLELKAVVQSLAPERERFERPYLLDAEALAKAAPAAAPDDDAIVLGDLKVTRVLPSGLSASFSQTVVKVVTQRGADVFRRQSFSWSPDRQEVKVERARIRKPDGTVVETYDESERSASEPWYRLYYDTMTRSLSFPALAPGDVLELAWRIEDTAAENLLSDYFGEITFVEETARKARFDYVLLVPAARTIHARVPDGVSHGTRPVAGGLVEHRFTAADVPRVDPEPAMPGWSEVARFVHVSTYASWDEVARFWWRLVRDQVKPTPEVRAEAERIAGEVLRERGGARLAKAAFPPAGGWDPATKRALVAAVHGFVVSRTRYVGLEFGIHGYKPYRVDQVLARRFGDCKDKASLTRALLEALGIDARLVLLRMRRLGGLPETPASLAAFNHAITYVPDLDLWLDGTAAWSGTRDLPAEDRGATVLVVSPEGPPRFARIPDARPEENRTELRFDVALAPDGGAAIQGSWRIAGVEAPGYRQAFLVPEERSRQLEESFNQTFSGVKVEEVTASELTRLEEDVAMSFRVAVPRYAQGDGGGLRFTPFGGARGYGEAWAPLSARRYDLEPGSPMETRFTYRYTLPPGWKVAELPEPVSVDGPFGGFSVRWREEGGAPVAVGHVRLAVSRVAAADYPAFRGFAAAIDRALARQARIVPAPKEGRR